MVDLKQNQKKSRHGGPRPGSGSKKGSKKLKTLQWEDFGRTVIEGNLPRVQAHFASLQGEELYEAWLKLIEYFKPKLARTEQQQLDKDGNKTDPAPITIKVE